MDEKKSVTNEFAIASLVLGIASFVQLMNLEKPILAIVFGILGLRRIGQHGSFKGKKLAIAGIILGVIGVTLTSIMTVKYLPQLKQMSQQMQQK